MNDQGRIAPLLSSVKLDWETPQRIFDACNEAYGPFTIDLAASPSNALCETFYSEEDDALSQTWTGRGWLNPPYGRRLPLWIRKARESVAHRADLVCMLIPARPDTRYWQEDIFLYASAITFLAGRIRFKGAEASAPFPSAVVVFSTLSARGALNLQIAGTRVTRV